MILRPARKRDYPAIKKLFLPWMDVEPEIQSVMDGLFHEEAPDQPHCNTLESDRTLLCASLWTLESPDTVRLWALGVNQSALEAGLACRFLREEILDWARWELNESSSWSLSLFLQPMSSP